jgi:hypothetical protein
MLVRYVGDTPCPAARFGDSMVSAGGAPGLHLGRSPLVALFRRLME